MKQRTLVIGDIHGAHKALLQVLERAKFNVEKDKIIFLADYVDGWSDSAKVINTLIEIKNKADSVANGHNIIFLKGNHDVWCETWLNTGVKHPYWFSNGGKATFNSYIDTGLLVEDSHKSFFRTLHNYYIDEQNRGFVHGGFISRYGLGHDVYKSDYHWDRDLWELAVLLDGERQNKLTSKNSRFLKHTELFIGHTATQNYKIKSYYKEYKDPNQPKNGGIIVPMNRCNVWNLDTGAGFNGKLTIMDINTKKYWQSDLVKTLYPNELGR